uniref:Integrase catalytic domain-containing protein n=1 Tax=Amphilophus citrinellus TaxID=61819 RepID=A0A3Q0S9L0_AMPCI
MLLALYFEIERLHNTTTSAVIHKMKGVFARHGIPEKVVSNNGPSHYFKSILSPNQRGWKRSLSCILRVQEHTFDGLKSPAQLLTSCRLRSILPTTAKQLQPQVAHQKTVCHRKEDCQSCQRKQYDKTARPLSTLLLGASVRPAETPRSYHIKTSDGQNFTRNRRHLTAQDNTQILNQQQSEVTTNDVAPREETSAIQPTHTTQVCEQIFYDVTKLNINKQK